MSIESLDALLESQQRLCIPNSVSRVREGSDRRWTYLSDRESLLPQQITILPHEPSPRLLAPNLHNHIPSSEVRTLICLALKLGLRPLWHPPVDMEVKQRRAIDDPLPLARCTYVLDRLAARSALVAVHLYLLEDPRCELMADESDPFPFAVRAVNNISLAPRSRPITLFADRFPRDGKLRTSISSSSLPSHSPNSKLTVIASPL